jgi:16S rRNA processing protein RimM
MKLIPVGRVFAAHGLKGEVKFRYYNETATAFPQYPSFFVDRAGTDVQLKPSRVRRQGNAFIIQFKGLERVEDVGFLLQKELCVAEDDLPALDEDEYYDYQLIGLRVVTEKGKVFGTVKDVMHVRAMDILVIEGVHEALVPMTEEHIVKIARAEGFVQVREEGLLTSEASIEGESLPADAGRGGDASPLN